MSAVPIIIIGKHPGIAAKVREDLMPEYDAIHVVLSVEQGMNDLPLLLSNPSEKPADTTGNYGSQTYGARPQAVAVGGGFNDEMIGEIKNACSKVDKGTVWLRGHYPSTVENMPPLSDLQAYGAAVARLVKKKLVELDVGKEGGERNEGEHFFN